MQWRIQQTNPFYDSCIVCTESFLKYHPSRPPVPPNSAVVLYPIPIFSRWYLSNCLFDFSSFLGFRILSYPVVSRPTSLTPVIRWLPDRLASPPASRPSQNLHRPHTSAILAPIAAARCWFFILELRRRACMHLFVEGIFFWARAFSRLKTYDLWLDYYGACALSPAATRIDHCSGTFLFSCVHP
jgi:hypothetical protein